VRDTLFLFLSLVLIWRVVYLIRGFYFMDGYGYNMDIIFGGC
jgi:hypothetical protein